MPLLALSCYACSQPFSHALAVDNLPCLSNQLVHVMICLLPTISQGEAGMMMGICKDVSDQDWSDAPYTTILTNGKGWMMEPASKKPVGAPAVIKVQQGKKYRLRIIQGAGSWGLKVTFPGHSCDVIALDGINIKPKPANGFVLTPGERLDCILHANQPVGNYYINIATLVGDNSPAVLSYVGAPDPKSMPPPKLSLGCDWALPAPQVLDFKNATGLKALPTAPKPPRTATKQLVMYLSNSADPEGTITNVLGAKPVIPGLTGVKPQQGCKLPNGQESQYCWTLNWVPFAGAKDEVPLLFPNAQLSPTSYVVDVPQGGVVDIALINPGAMVHPMHLHGTHFWVLGTGNGNILNMDGSINYTTLNIDNPIYRDTQPVVNAAPPSRLGMGPMANSNRKTAMTPMPGMPGSKPPAMTPMPGMPGAKPAATTGMPGMPGEKPPAMTPMPGMPGRKLAAMTQMPGMPGEKPAATPTMPGMPGSKPPAMAAMPGMPGEKLVPGYAVVRFKATNPGVWPLHCHIDLHANTGMLMAFRVPRVGKGGPWALPKDVLTCGAE
jgi:FtsP/CotA-like multicopper oxidase with cupredoxin domain